MKITNTFFKKSSQRNIKINADYYSTTELKKMYFNGDAFVLTRKGEVITVDKNDNENDVYFLITDRENDLRIFLENITEIKVIVDEYGMLATVAVVNGVQIFVEV